MTTPAVERGGPEDAARRASDPANRAALFGLSVLVLFLLRRAVFLGRTFYVRDIHLQWYGQVESFVRSVAGGSWPVWDPFVSFGQPLLANPNAEVVYPFTWLNLVLLPPTYYTVFFAAHLFLGAAGLHALARHLGLSRGGAALAAALWTASGPVLSLGNLWNHLAAAAWLPWVLLGTRRGLASAKGADVALWGGAMAAQILAGSPDVFLMTALLSASEVVLSLRFSASERARDRRSILAAGGAAALALALAAVQILPSLELAARSAARSGRAGLGAAIRTYWSLHPASLLQTAVPLAWNDLPLTPALRASLFESREPLLFSYYLGLPALLLAAQGLMGPRRPRRAALVLAAVAAALVALGPHAPVYGLALRVVPFVSALRYPSKAMIVVAFSCALLAAMGFDAWREAHRLRSIALLSFGLAILALVVLLVLHVRADAWGPSLVSGPPGFSYAALLAPARDRLMRAALLSAAVGALALGRRGRARMACAALAGALAVGDLVFTHDGLNPTAPRELLSFRPEILSRIHQADLRRLFVVDYYADRGMSRRDLGREVPYALKDEAGLATWAGALLRRAYPVSPIAAAWGIYGSYSGDLLGLQPLGLAQMHAVLVRSLGTPLFVRLLRIGAVSQVLALHTLEGLPRVAEVESPFPEPIGVFDVPDPLPRAYAVSGARVAEGEDALRLLADPAFDPTREVILPSGAGRPADPAFTGSVRVAEQAPDRIALDVDLGRGAFVVLVDGYDPGWRVTVDSRQAPLLQANVGFRAVAVPQGRHRVEMTFRPPAVLWGLGVTGLGLAGLAVAATRPTGGSKARLMRGGEACSLPAPCA